MAAPFRFRLSFLTLRPRWAQSEVHSITRSRLVDVNSKAIDIKVDVHYYEIICHSMLCTQMSSVIW